MRTLIERSGYTLAGQTTPQEVVTYHYDTLGRQTEVDDSVAGDTTYAYDADGHVTQVTSPQGVVNHAYDPATGQLVRTWTGDGSLDESFTYDGAGRLATATVTELDGSAVDQVTSYTYDLAGNLRSTTTNTGSATLTATYGYDDLDRLTSLVNATGGTAASSFAYQYDAAGHKTHVVEVGVDGAGVTRTISYGYDADGRLTSDAETANGATTTTGYTYDLVGNRLTQTVNGTTTTSTYDARDRLTGQTGGVTYDYDADGNTLDQKTNGSVTQSYTWDARGRMHSATVNGTTETYTYDDGGDRIQVASTAAGTTRYLFDDASPTGYAQVLAETNGGATTAYAYGLQRLSTTAGGTTHVYLYDGHGSVVQLANAAGAVTDRYVYDDWGTVVTASGTTANPYRYAGMRLDGLTGLYDDNARYYQTADGRFTSADEEGYGLLSDPLSLNGYLFSVGDPTDTVDLNGHQASPLPNSTLGTFVSVYVGRLFEAFSDLGGIGPAGVSRFGNRTIRRIINTISPGANVPYISPNRDRPDLVQVNGASTGDVYEIKHGNILNYLFSASGFLADAAPALADLRYYVPLLNSFGTTTAFASGVQYAPGVTAYPLFPFNPPGEVLVTFDNYAAAPGAILWDFVPDRDTIVINAVKLALLPIFGYVLSQTIGMQALAALTSLNRVSEVAPSVSSIDSADLDSTIAADTELEAIED